MKIEIEEWLAAPEEISDFSRGVDLLERVGSPSDKVLAGRLRAKANNWAKSKLRYLLNKALEALLDVVLPADLADEIADAIIPEKKNTGKIKNGKNTPKAYD